MKLRKLFILLISLIVPFFVTAKTQRFDQEIKWTALQNIQISENTTVARMYFEGVFYDDYSPTTPLYRQKIKLDGEVTDISAQMSDAVFEPLTSEEILTLENLLDISSNIELKVKLATASKKPVALVEFLPFRLNSETGKYEKLVAFKLALNLNSASTKAGQSREFAENSVLSTGKWFKIRVNKTGIYKITTADLTAMGVNVASVNSANLRLYGNGGGMLPEKNSDFRHDDLQENAIEVVDGGDGKFDNGDYFLFYGEAPDKWAPNAAGTLFNHQKNVYSDYTYYFITTDLGAGKRILNEVITGITPNITISQFNDYDFHEKDEVNLIKSGREWYGDLFDLQTTLTFPFTFPNIDVSAYHHVTVKAVAKSLVSSTYVVSVNNEVVTSMIIPNVSDNPNGYYARSVSSEKPFVSSTPEVNVTLKYNKSTSTSTGWLDFIEVNVIRNLVFTSGQMGFRSLASVGATNISEFRISNAPAEVRIWDVTDPTNVKQREGPREGSTLKITIPTPKLNQFMAFNGSEFLAAEFVATVTVTT